MLPAQAKLIAPVHTHFSCLKAHFLSSHCWQGTLLSRIQYCMCIVCLRLLTPTFRSVPPSLRTKSTSLFPLHTENSSFYTHTHTFTHSNDSGSPTETLRIYIYDRGNSSLACGDPTEEILAGLRGLGNFRGSTLSSVHKVVERLFDLLPGGSWS